MKKYLQHHWKENIRPAIFLVLCGSLILVGMRLAEKAWPEKSKKVYICFEGATGIEACEIFRQKDI